MRNRVFSQGPGFAVDARLRQRTGADGLCEQTLDERATGQRHDWTIIDPM